MNGLLAISPPPTCSMAPNIFMSKYFSFNFPPPFYYPMVQDNSAQPHVPLIPFLVSHSIFLTNFAPAASGPVMETSTRTCTKPSK